MQNISVKALLTTRSILWLAAFGILATLLALLTKAIMDNPSPSQDVRVLDWVVGWDLPGLGTFFHVISFVTSWKAGIILGPVGIAFLLLMGRSRAAVVFGAAGLSIGLVAILGDLTLGEIVDRGRPLAGSDNPAPAFPSGHVFASTVFFGFIGFLAAYYRMKSKILIPMLVLFAALIVLVAPARIHAQAHWPSDVAAGYLLAAIWLLVMIPIFIYLRGTKWMSSWQNKENPAVVACES